MTAKTAVTGHESHTTALVIQICAWCLPEIRVLSAPRSVATAPAISFELDKKGFPKSAHALVNHEVVDIQISHGICGACAKKLYKQ